jgi:raffinose/stachyose/melibiose transport system permease protein
VFFYVLFPLLCLIWLIPVVFIVFTALKSHGDLYTSSWFLPPKIVSWGNFKEAWTQGNMGTYIRNSAIICIVKVPLGIAVSALASFALSRMSFRWADLTFFFFFLGMLVPVQATLVPNKILLGIIHLYDTIPGLTLIYVAFGIPFGVLILRGFMRTIPKELDDAAFIDGCSHFATFRRIIVPLSGPAIATLIILDFLGTWNDFLFATVYIQNDAFRTITTGLLQFRRMYQTDYTLMNAGVLMSVIPIFVVFLLFQRYFVSGLSGALKG